jgi:hypothetical protein
MRKKLRESLDEQTLQDVVRNEGRWSYGLILLGALVPIVAIVLFVCARNRPMGADTSVVTDEALVAGACAMLLAYLAAATILGGGLGFLFGVPRTAAVEAQRTGGNRPNSNTGGSRPNSNLEQISDWLTKVLVGATLTQVGRIPGAATELFIALGSPLGVGDAGTVFAGAITVYGLIFGFCAAWITTRVWLERMLETIDAECRNLVAAPPQTALPSGSQHT